MPSPDEKLVYLHCSSIFTGVDAEIRKLKSVRQRLIDHKISIQALTRNFSVPHIAIVAQKLLKEGVFQSTPLAERRFPDLFRQPETEEATNRVSKVNVTRLEAKEAHEALSTSEEDTDSDYDGTSANLRRLPSHDFRCGTSGENASLHSPSSPTVNLQHFFLPFKRKHQVLTSVQMILEECCFDFGRTWVPSLMEAHNWHEIESVELTQWVKAFCKHNQKIPSSATRSIAGKSLKQVLFETSSLRHAAVHRLPTTAADLESMLRAAQAFTTALNDPLRTSEIEKIRNGVPLTPPRFNADGLHHNSRSSSYGHRTDELEPQPWAQNQQEGAADSVHEQKCVYEDQLELFPRAKGNDQNELDVENTLPPTFAYPPSHPSTPTTQEPSEATDWLSILNAAPTPENGLQQLSAHTATTIPTTTPTAARHNTIPATPSPPQTATSTRSSSIPQSIKSADPHNEMQISMPSLVSLVDADVLEPIASLVSTTRTAILDRAWAAYEWCVADD